MKSVQSPLRDVCRAGASRRFGKYTAEEEKGARQISVAGDEPERLRRKREFLRSMSPEHALEVIEFHQNLNIFEALALARKEGKILVPEYVNDRIMQEREEFIEGWTGTAVIYERPDTPFGDKVIFSWEYLGVLFAASASIPEKFRGKTNCALVVEHPDFDFAALGNNSFELRIEEGSIAIVENFPKNGVELYGLDERFRIPVDDSRRISSSLRHFRRRDDNSCLGPLVRDCNNYFVWRGRRYAVGGDYKLHYSLGAALF